MIVKIFFENYEIKGIRLKFLFARMYDVSAIE